MNEESVNNRMNEDDAPIWNLETYEKPISKNNNDPLKKKYTHIVLISSMVLIVLLSAITVLAIKFKLPRRIALWNPSEETIRQDVSAYLEERYDEKFVITNIIFPNFNYASYIITAYPEGKPEKSDYKITIHGWENKGLIDYYDNYPVVKIKPELTEYISNIVDKFFVENRVYVQNFHQEWIRENIEKNFSFDEFLNDIEGEWHSAGWYHICIPYKGQNDKELLRSINEMIGCIAESNVSGFFYVDIIYKNYELLSDDYDHLELGEYERDFVDYDYYIDRYGNYDKFDEETEVRTHGTK